MRIEWIEKYMYEAERMIVQGGHEMQSGLDILNGLLYEEPGYGSLHNHLGWAHLYYTFDFAQAELHLKTAVRFHPEFQAPYLHLGTLYLRQGRYQEAIDILTTGLTKPQANKTSMLDIIGQSYEMLQEYGRAIKAYREAKLFSMSTGEMNIFSDGIKRCYRKRWASILKY